jgi:phage terminase large subunit-like protein
VSSALTLAEEAQKLDRQIAQAQAELKRIRHTRIDYIFPETGPYRRELYPKHMEFIAAGATHREVAFIAANRCGKTLLAAYQVSCHLTGKYPKWWDGKRFTQPIEVWACGTTNQTTRDIVQANLLGAVGDEGTGLIAASDIISSVNRSGIPGAVDTAFIQHVSGGRSRLGMKSFEQGRKSFEGTGKSVIWCIAAGELVQMGDGTLRPIELVGIGDDVLTLDRSGAGVVRRVTASVCRGMKPCIQLQPRHGTSLICTPDHEVFRGYMPGSHRPAADLDYVAQPRPGVWWPADIKDRSDAWYVWGALAVSEGCTSQRKITNSRADLIEYAATLLPEGCRVRKQEYKNAHVPDWHLVWPDFWRDFPEGLSSEKVIPDWVFTSSAEKARLFARWLFMGDGWACRNGIGYATTSRALAVGVVVLLSRLGIRASMNPRQPQNGRWSKQYFVTVQKGSDVLKFCNDIGIEGKAAAVFAVKEEAIRRIESNAVRSEKWLIHGRREFSERNSAAKLKAARVKYWTEEGEREVFDITVETQHRFLCGTSLVSNCDEEPPLEVYVECLIRLATTKGIMLCTFTPLQGWSDVVKSFIEPGDGAKRWWIQAGWNDCPHLDEKTKAELLLSIPPHQRDARTKGTPSLGSGAIYPVAESDVMVEPFEIPKHWPRVYGMDVGWNRTAVVWLARDPEDGCIYIYSEHYMGSEKPPIHAAAIKARGEWIPGVIDPASNGRSQLDGQQLLAIYRQLGLKLSPADNSVETGIYEVWTLLSSGQLKIFSSCGNWFSEFRKYRRDERGRIVKADDHEMDASRYGIVSGRNRMIPCPAPRRVIRESAPGGERGWMA